MSAHLRLMKWFGAACFLALMVFGAATETENGQNAECSNNPMTASDMNAEERLKRTVDMTSNGNSEPFKFEPTADLKIVKRAPNGFTGMRGKKTSSDYDIEDIDPLTLALAMDDPNNNDYGQRYKKAPFAFYGAHGQKYSSGGNDFNHLNELLQEIEENRMRQTLLHDLLQLSSVAENEVAKRAPTGFTGMRGKRPAMETFGNDFVDDPNISKRARANAFVGVRGKKDVSHQTFKRSPIIENEKSYGSRAKPQRRFVDLSNKFVAVRGKKSDSDDMTENDNSLQWHLNVGPAKQRYFNTFPDLLFGEKRTPNGFVGMRGKRSINKTDLSPE